MSPVKDSEAEQHRRQSFFTKLLDALWSPADEEGTNGTYAAGGIIAPPQQGVVLDSLHVQGAGELRLPLSAEDTPKLRGVCEQAPFGQGSATVIDTAVRRSWQVDASKVSFPEAPLFISKTAQLLAMKAVRALGLDGAALQLEAHLYKLLLYDSDGHFKVHRDTEKEPGMFATLVLQLPTEAGFEGGALVVSHKNTSKIFDFSMVSSTAFCYTVFFADCQHELLKVTAGTRLCLAFNLVRRNASSDEVLQLGELKEFSSKLGKAEAALQPWLEVVMEETPNMFGDKLAIPLQHQYTKENLSFAGLKGDDRIVAQVLKNCRDSERKRWLDLHLCILTKHKRGAAEDDHYSRSRSRRWYDNESDLRQHTMVDVFGEDIRASNWVGLDNKTVGFALDVDFNRQVVTGKDPEDELFHVDDGPDEEEYEGYTGNSGPTLEYWYHKAMIVVWPKKRSMSIACNAGVAGALDILECKQTLNEPDDYGLLCDILNYCEKDGSMVWHFPHHADPVTSRLLNLCLRAGGLEDILRVLKLLLKTRQYNQYNSEVVKWKVGVRNADVATIIATVVQRYGWDVCGSIVMELLEDCAVGQGESFVHLALELQTLGCRDAAVSVAKKTFELVWTARPSFDELNSETICNVVKMLFSLEELHNELGPKIVERFEEIDTAVLCTLVIQIHATNFCELYPTPGSSSADGAAISTTKSEDPATLHLFLQICQMITTRDFHRSSPLKLSQPQSCTREKSVESRIVDLFCIFFMLGNKLLFDKLIQGLLDQSRLHKQQHLLKTLLDSDVIWKELSGAAMGRSGIHTLANERIQILSEHGRPDFTWCQPFAELPNHPTVQAFLRGPEESITYQGVNDLPHARNFARKYFNGTYQNGYSAIGKEGGRGAGAYCDIRKNRRVFEFMVEHWKIEQEELKMLRLRLEKLGDVDRAQSIPDTENLSPNVNALKRKIVDVEVINRTRPENMRNSAHTDVIDLGIDGRRNSENTTEWIDLSLDEE